MSGRNEYNEAVRQAADRWVPANGGTEVPNTAADGTRYLYVVNPARALGHVPGPLHAWLNLDTDAIEYEDPYQREGKS